MGWQDLLHSSFFSAACGTGDRYSAVQEHWVPLTGCDAQRATNDRTASRSVHPRSGDVPAGIAPRSLERRCLGLPPARTQRSPCSRSTGCFDPLDLPWQYPERTCLVPFVKIDDEQGTFRQRDGDGVDDEHDRVSSVLTRVGSRIASCDCRPAEADQRSVLDELDTGHESLFRGADDLLLELYSDTVVAEVRAHDRNAPHVWQIGHGHSVARPDVRPVSTGRILSDMPGDNLIQPWYAA
jgi:hypothetical protein